MVASKDAVHLGQSDTVFFRGGFAMLQVLCQIAWRIFRAYNT
jgi:hypothetical protein